MSLIETYTKFEISFFRSFSEKQTIEFAQPNNSHGSGITYIVGENNVGKTTLVEALVAKNRKNIKTSEKGLEGELLFGLYGAKSHDEDFYYEMIVDPNVDYQLIYTDSYHDGGFFEVVPSRRHWGSTLAGTRTAKDEVGASARKDLRSRGGSQTAEAFRDLKEKGEYIDFIDFVQGVLPDFCDYEVVRNDQLSLRYKTRNGALHSSELLGDGVISILKICLHLFLDSHAALIIDEPELSLHPLAQKRLLKIIAEKASKRQIIISTHSPYFVSWEYLKNGAKLNRVTKYSDEKSEIHTLKDYNEYVKLIKGAKWRQPFLMDTVAKEIFFSDKLLFVEGQEDVGLLKMAGDLQENINIFGYGVMGKDNFSIALKLSRDLGVKKAAVLLDAGEDENIIKSKLSDSCPDYKIVQWDRGDIRDKEFRDKCVVGYFDQKGKKKGVLGDYYEKIEEINDYFDDNSRHLPIKKF